MNKTKKWRNSGSYNAPEIFNCDQGCQFTSEAFTSVRKTWNVRISMDGKGRFQDSKT